VASCRSCDAEVLFVPSAKTGTPMILDAVPDDAGNVLVRGGFAVVVSRAVQPLPGEQRWMPHPATCPSAAAWKGRRRA